MGNVDLEVGVVEVGTDLGELLSVVEGVATSEEVASRDEILGGGDDGFSVSGRDEILLDVHELESFGSSFLSLRYVWLGKKLINRCDKEGRKEDFD